MDIIAVVGKYIEEIFAAAEEFQGEEAGLGKLEERLMRASRESAREVLGEILSDTDQFLEKAKHREENYTVQRHDQRTLISNLGDVKFRHTLYRSRRDGSYHYLLDERLHLPKDEHFTEMAEVKMLEEAAQTSYQKAAEKVSAGTQSVSKVSVMNKIHQIVEELPEKEPEEKKRLKYLYIEADEDHIHRQKAGKELKGSCIIGKLIYVHEGRRKVCEGRTELVNPVYFGGRYSGEQGNRALWERVQEYIAGHYDTESLKRVYLSGDGGAWIKAGTEYVAKSCFVADRFHLMKYINRAAKQALDEENEVKGKLYRYIWKDQPKKAEKLLKRLLRSAGNEKAVEDCRSFLKNNWEGIKRAFHDKEAQGCSAEGHVSHVYSDRMSSRPMGWSETGADRMCRLRCHIQTSGNGKVIELVRARREAAYAERVRTGTNGIEPEVEVVRKQYTKSQMEAAAYAERMHVELSSTLTRKQIGICLNRKLF